MTPARVGLFGEVLFDHFPDGRRVLGGAPFNVAWHLQAFGESPLFISRVGDDEAGAEVLRAMHAWGMDTHAVEVDPDLPTGRVAVRLEAGEPEYEIVYPAAFDAIGAGGVPVGMKLLYHGSLALRDDRSRAALAGVIRECDACVFMDVNLRAPWWQREAVLDRVAGADWVKLNRVELLELEPGSRAKDDESGRAGEFMTRHDLDGLLLTRGHRGAEALACDGRRVSVAPVEAARIVDTVGAGDAFAAVSILGLRRDWPLDVILERAQAFAACICGVRGATVSDAAFYRPHRRAWGLDKEREPHV